MKQIKIMKIDPVTGLPYDAGTDVNPNHTKYWSLYPSLKYFKKEPLAVTLPAADVGKKAAYTHGLGYYPYVEVLVSVDGQPYEYCPSINSGASVEYYSSFRVTSTQVEVFVGSTGFPSDKVFNFIIFIYKNNLGFS